MSSIKKNISKGIFYTALSKYSDIVVSIIISAILARLLTPEEFGIVATAMVFISFFNLLSNFGFSPAIVQNKSLTQKDIGSIFTVLIIFGLLLSIVFYFSAKIISSFYEVESLIPLIKLMSIIIFFQTLQIVPLALARKKMLFKKIGIISVATHIASGSVAIVLAFLDFGFYALVINSILNSLLLFIAYYVIQPIIPVLFPNFSAIKKIAKFSFFQFMFNFINYFSRNLDNLLIPKFFNSAALGFYDKAYRLMMMPVQNLTHVITPVLHPVLSDHQDDPQIVINAYKKIVRVLATIGFPLSIILYFCAEEIILILYGSQWINSIEVFSILALSVGIQIVLSSTGAIFQTTNRTDLMFYSGLLSTLLMLLGIGYGLFIGKTLYHIGLGILIGFSINFFQGFYLLIKLGLKEKYLLFLKLFIYPISTSILIFIILFFVNQIDFDSLLISIIFKVSISTLAFVIITPLSNYNRSLIKEIGLEKFITFRK